MAAVIVLALQMMFGSQSAAQPTSAQIQQATSNVGQSSIVVIDQSIVQ